MCKKTFWYVPSACYRKPKDFEIMSQEAEIVSEHLYRIEEEEGEIISFILDLVVVRECTRPDMVS